MRVPMFVSKSFAKTWGLNQEKLAEVRGLLEDLNWRRDKGPPPRRPLFAGCGHVKKLARLEVYETVATLVSSGGRVLMLAGGEPQHEIDLARNVLDADQVLAFDTNEPAVYRAKQSGADCTVRFSVADLRFNSAHASPKCLRDRYVFANMDFCGHVTSKEVAKAIDRAACCSEYVATWFSYGLDGEKMFDHVDISRHEWREVPELIARRMAMVRSLVFNINEYEGQYGRTRRFLRPISVWSYVDQTMPMMCVLWRSDSSAFDRVDYEGRDSQNVPVHYERIECGLDDFKDASGTVCIGRTILETAAISKRLLDQVPGPTVGS